MKKIKWIEFVSKKYGGVVYENELKKVLSGNFDLDLVKIDSRFFKRGYLRGLELLFNLIALKGKSDLIIRNGSTVFGLGLDRMKGDNIAIIHHIDSSTSPFPFRIIDWFLDQLTYFNLKKAKAIVTVSEYWMNHFLRKGYREVYKAYNPFDLSQFDISDEEVEEFKRKNQLEDDKPIIYLGNCQASKGVVESYEVLKDLDVTLVTAGEQFVKIPARNFEVPYRDYLKLLKASTIVLSMSKFKEGWSRTTHEAMLLKTPVIGSGKGGMRELLEGGKQIICPEFSSLQEKVVNLLNDTLRKEKMGQDGYSFAKEFTLERFEKDWKAIIEKLIQ